jgi:hypothetical protein
MRERSGAALLASAPPSCCYPPASSNEQIFVSPDAIALSKGPFLVLVVIVMYAHRRFKFRTWIAEEAPTKLSHWRLLSRRPHAPIWPTTFPAQAAGTKCRKHKQV